MTSPGQLLRVLARLGTARAGELARQLGVSQPTVSRLVGAAGERVCRMGRGRSTRYAATRELPGLGTRLPVHRIREDGRVEPCGELQLLEGGGHWFGLQEGAGLLFQGLPPFAVDMSPQGYIGRTFSTRFPELELPTRLADWSDDHRLLALAHRGEDCVGNLVIGRASLDRWLASPLAFVERSQYPGLALHSAQSEAGSSAGGEHPKFLAYSEGRHVLVKFAGSEGAAALRWRDLLVCESLALTQVREAGRAAASARWFDEGGLRFLEVERFDRVGERGRRGLLSLAAYDAESIGSGGSWSRFARSLHEAGQLDTVDERQMRWLDVFGQLIGNTDRHLGNLSLFSEVGERSLRLAPVYDMLPMLFAPSGTLVVERAYAPAPPTADTLDVWPDAAHHADRYWRRTANCAELSDDMRRRAETCRAQLAALRERVPM